MSWTIVGTLFEDFRIKTVFGLSLPPVVCRRAHVLFTLFVFVCILCFVFVLFVFCVASFSGFSMFERPLAII